MAVVPDVRLEPASGDLRGQPSRMTVDDRLCLVPPTAPARALAYVTGTSTVPWPPDVLASLNSPEAGLTPERLHEMLGLLARAAVAGRPEALVPADDPLGRLLAERVSLKGQDHAALRRDAEGGDIPALLDRLTAPTVDLMIDPSYLEELTTGQDGGELFTFMRDGLFVELGFALPRMHVSLDPALRSRGFAFRFNSVSTLPWIGLASDVILVNDTPERLALMEVAGVPATNPATGQPGVIVVAGQKDMLEAAGLTTWDAFGYYILTLAAEIRAHLHALASPNRVQELVRALSAAFPAVVANLPGRQIDEVLTPLVRQLLADQVPIRDLRRVVELMRHHRATPEVVDDLDLTSFVRTGLADATAEKLGRGTDTLVVYLLDPEVEQGLAGRTGATVATVVAEDLREALYAEMAHLPPTAQRPLLLTSQPSRSAAQDVLREEFPLMRVVSHAEVPPGYNIQPVARISRPEAQQSAGGGDSG